jgi:hypothetical protein
LKTYLLKKYWPKTLLWKAPLLKTNWFYELKTTTPKKNILAKKETCESKTYLVLLLGWLTVCVSRWWAGVDSVWEQEKLEASVSTGSTTKKCL